MAHANYRSSDGLNDVPVSLQTPLPVTAVDEAGQPISPGTVAGLTYTDTSIASLSANQAAGTTAILAASATRKALVINPPANCGLALSSGGPVIWPLFANVPNSFIGQECPTAALYLTTGLSAAQALPIAVA
jgi:hypothetical protein